MVTGYGLEWICFGVLMVGVAKSVKHFRILLFVNFIKQNVIGPLQTTSTQKIPEVEVRPRVKKAEFASSIAFLFS